MRKIWLVCAALFLIGTVPVLAHVQNEKNLYSDIEYSEAKEQIVILHGIRAIALEGGANLYRPFELLTRADLAFWAGNFKGLGGLGATADTIRQAALAEGIVSSLEGNATYGDVNQAYFAGQAPVEDETAMLSREEFATYMGRFFSEEIDGHTLFDMVGYTEGPTGIVEEVERTSVIEGGNTFDVFRFAVDGQWYQVSHHPKILNGPVDLTQWQDKFIESSWYAPASADGAELELEIIKVGEAQFSDEEIGAIADTPVYGEPAEDASVEEDGAPGGSESNSPNDPQPSVTTNTGGVQDNTPGGALPITLVIGGILLIILAVWLFVRRK